MESAKAVCEPVDDPVCAQNAIAWTYQYSQEFHVCPNFFEKAWHGTIEEKNSEASSIILHELTHCFGTDDFAYGEDLCSKLSAEQASKNADSYRLFSMNSIYHINNKNNNILKYDPDSSIDFRPIPFEDKVIILPIPNNGDQSANPIESNSSPVEN